MGRVRESTSKLVQHKDGVHEYVEENEFTFEEGGGGISSHYNEKKMNEKELKNFL